MSKIPFSDIVLYVFDFDGTLVDSYSCLPSVWMKIASLLGVPGERVKDFIREVLVEEDIGESTSSFTSNRVPLWVQRALGRLGLDVPRVDWEALTNVFWEERTRGTRVLPCAREILEYLRSRGRLVASVSGGDGVKSMKRRRIRESGLEKYFSDIVVSGEDVASKVDALNLLLRKYGLGKNQLLFIDDKVEPINRAAKAGYLTVRVGFKPLFERGWVGECSPTLFVKDLCILLKVIRRHRINQLPY